MDCEIIVKPNLLKIKQEYDKKVREGVNESDMYVLSNQRIAKKLFKGHILPCGKYTNIFKVIGKGMFLAGALSMLMLSMAWFNGMLSDGLSFELLYSGLLTFLIGVWVASLIGISDIKHDFRMALRYINRGWSALVIEK